MTMKCRYDPDMPPLMVDAVRDMKKKGLLPQNFIPQKVNAPGEYVSEEIRLSRVLDKEMLFRFAYVPFVIAQLVWDYADTITTLTAWMRLRETLPLNRKVKELRMEYDRKRAPFIDKTHQASEIENMYTFEDGVKEIFNLYLLNLRLDLQHEYPDLQDEDIDLLTATYQCLILLKSLHRYVAKQTAKVQRIVGRQIGRILPCELYALEPIIAAYVGDKPISDKFRKQQGQYVETLSTQIALIGLNDTVIKQEQSESI